MIPHSKFGHSVMRVKNRSGDKIMKIPPVLTVLPSADRDKSEWKGVRVLEQQRKYLLGVILGDGPLSNWFSFCNKREFGGN